MLTLRGIERLKKFIMNQTIDGDEVLNKAIQEFVIKLNRMKVDRQP